MSDSLVIRPEIKNGEVVTIEIGFESLPLKRPVPLSDFPKLVTLLEQISEYIDFGGQSGWTLVEIDSLIWNGVSEKSHEFLKIIAKKSTWVNRDQILQELKIDGRVLAGALSSPGQYFSRYKKDPIYEKANRMDENGNENTYYRIKPEYLEMVRQSFEFSDESDTKIV